MRARNIGWGVLAAGGAIAFGYLCWIVLQPGPTDFATVRSEPAAIYNGPAPTGVPSSLAAADRITQGEYLARAADCEACHTARGDTPFAGGRAFKLPFGTIFTPNITPDQETGIGRWSDAEFVRAVHKGIGRDGQRLYPAFPYASYSLLSDDDVLAIKAYLFSLAPVHRQNRDNTFVFPFNQRWSMAAWSALFNRDTRFAPVPGQSAEWNRGAYLVEAAGHCGECHSPRNLFQAMDMRQKFSGGAAEGWTAYNITSDSGTGISAWSARELADYLRKGHALGRGTASGPMAEVVELSTRHLSDDDIAAMVTYLRSIPPIKTFSLSNHIAGPAPADPTLAVGDLTGRRVFEGACASCHDWTGSGRLAPQAQLTGSRAVNDASAVNVVQMILTGTGKQSGSHAFMPSFAQAYSNTEIAAVANYVTARFGSAPSQVTPDQVAKLRSVD